MPRKRKGSNWTKRKYGKKGKQDNDKTLTTPPLSTCIDNIELIEQSGVKRDHQPITLVPKKLHIVRGTRSQNDDRFSITSRNHQCTANSAVALAYSNLISFSAWNSTIVDNVLDYGDCLYNNSISVRNSQDLDGFRGNPNLMVIEVHPTFIIDSVLFTLNIHETNTVTGRIESESEVPFFRLTDGLQEVFRKYEAAIFTCGLLSTCIRKSSAIYYLYDSHSRDADGRHVEYGGTACLIRFLSSGALLRFLCYSYDSDALYTLVPITVQLGPAGNLPNIDLYLVLTLYDGISFDINPRLSAELTQSSLNSSSILGELDLDSTIEESPSKKRLRDVPFEELDVSPHFLGKMDYVCPHCKALFFPKENMICCSKGIVRLPANTEYPELLKTLITGVHPQSKEFIKNIRKYNSLLSLGSTTTSLPTDKEQRAPVVVVSGQIHHRVSNINPSDPKFGSLYFIDPAEAKQIRASNEIQVNCDPSLLEQIDALLRNTHPFARMYRNLGQVVKDLKQTEGTDISQLGLYFYKKPGTNRNVYAAPTASDEIGAVFKSDDGDLPPPGQIRIFCQENKVPCMDIPKLSPIVDALCYPLLFPNGELGWSTDLLVTESNKKRKRISKRQFDCYRLMSREAQLNPILLCGRLTQQYIIDKYVELEGHRLYYMRTNQVKLRAESYVGLQDYVARKRASQSVANETIGKVFILPSTFVGGPRFMQQNYQDALAIMAKFGRPSLFVTFTCNPDWPEIRENMGSTILKVQDRPELVARIFDLKRRALFEDILQKEIFGRVIAFVYVVEFQKRGLPHIHCLLTLADKDKPREPDDVDKIICAELPKENTRLFDVVMASMIHGPCGSHDPNSPCMENGVCSKRYPKPFSETTDIDQKWPVYRRRNDGRTALLKKNNKSFLVDNRHVVPYNPYLSLKYGSHINVEFVTGLTIVKSVFKYINKGPDTTVLQVRNETSFDEIKTYLDSRYVSSGEAAWKLFGLHIQGKSHSIIRLPVHLPGERTVQFVEGQEEEALQIQENKVSLLEAFFELNVNNPGARDYKYCEIPLYYSFDRQKKCWIVRKRNVKVIPRLFTISPKYAEKFHLRILLLHVVGPRSFEDLRTFDGVTYSTFQEAARARCLVPSDDEWVKTLEHAAQVDMPSGMRKMFAYLLCYCEVGNPTALWTTFKHSMSKDFRGMGHSESVSENCALGRIDSLLRTLGKTATEFHLPEVLPDLDVELDDEYPQSESEDFDPSRLNPDQRGVFDRVIRAVESEGMNLERYFYLQGSGGTGKTHVYNTLLNHCIARRIPVAAVAFTGIAALLLKNGRTVHSTFRLPLDLDADSRSTIKIQSEEAIILRNLKFIIWDEVSMASYHALNAVDRLLQDICSDNRPFGGKCILLGGDIKQLLPVAAGKVQQIKQFFTNCASWIHFQVLNLKINMRTDTDVGDFADWLEKLGRGTINETRHDISNDTVRLPDHCLTTNVVRDVYGQLDDLTSEQLASRTILCPKNEHCNVLNDRTLKTFPGPLITIISNDSVASGNEDEIANFPVEYLNSLTPSGMPLHQLNLKVGVPIILVRNVSLTDGLINGTRLIVLAVTDVLLTAEIVTGRFSGRTVLIPRLDLISSDKDAPFILKRRQFPVKVCFALTINKAQGQTFSQVGIYLETPVFSHGQLYVAFSRARNWNSVKVEVVETKHQGKLLKGSENVFAKNIVFGNVLDSIK